MADTQTIEILIIVNSTEYLHYRIIEGANRVVLATETQAVFASDALFNKFAYLEIDGQRVPDSMYLAESGATVITPKHGCLRSLETGMHDLTIYSTDGSASTHFTLVSPATRPRFLCC